MPGVNRDSHLIALGSHKGEGLISAFAVPHCGGLGSRGKEVGIGPFNNDTAQSPAFLIGPFYQRLYNS